MIATVLLGFALGTARAQDADEVVPEIPPLAPEDFAGWEKRYRRRMRTAQVGLVAAAAGPSLALFGLGSALISPNATVDDIAHGVVWAGLGGMVLGAPLLGVWSFRAGSALDVLGHRPAIWPGVVSWLALGSMAVTLPLVLDQDNLRPAIYAIGAHYYGFLLFGAGQLLVNGTAYRRAPRAPGLLGEWSRHGPVWALAPMVQGRVASLGVVASF